MHTGVRKTTLVQKKKKNPNSFKTQYLKSMEGKINHKKGGGYHPMQHTQGSYITAT